MSTFSLVFSATILAACLAQITTAASVSITSHSASKDALPKMTCRHQNEAKKKIWKTCVKTTESDLIPSYKESGLNLPSKLSYGQMPIMDIPPK